MASCRNLLPVNLLDEFAAWLAAMDIQCVETKAPFAEFGVKINNQTYLVYVRDDTHAGGETVHASIYGPVIQLARRFLNERKAPKA